MKCPIFSIAPGIDDWEECKREECAWWVSLGKEEGCCAIFSIAISLDHLDEDDLVANLTAGLDDIASHLIGISKK